MWDSPSFWIWVIIAVVSYLARKKKPKQPTTTTEPYETQPESKPISFEDLLREIQQSKAPQPAPSANRCQTTSIASSNAC